MRVEHYAEENQPAPFPTEVTFKAIFHNRPMTMESLRSIFSAKEIAPEISTHPSRNGKFISYTVTAYFSSEELLKRICAEISSLEGWMTMF